MTPVTPELWLERNLTALARRDPALAQRLCWAVDDSHVARDDRGQLQLRVQQSWVPLDLSAEQLQTALGDAPDAAGNTQELFVFGAGTGDLPARLLASPARAPVTVWDRDPFMLRLTLSRADWSEDLISGRLRLALGCDLWGHLAPSDRRIVLHPILAQVYRNERALLTAAPSRRALICAGGLFVDDLADGLRGHGHAVFTLDTSRLSVEELTLTVRVTQPVLVAAVNHTEGLAEFCEAEGVPLLCWEVDPALQRLANVTSPPLHARIFTYRRGHVADFERAGFPAVTFLPLATNPARRMPPALTAEEIPRFAVPVAFVGASLVDRIASLRADFARAFVAFAGEGGGVAVADGALRILDDVLARQRADLDHYMIPTLLDQLAPGLREHGKRPGAYDAEQIAGELAAGEKRLALIGALARGLAEGDAADSEQPQVHVWGDPGWRAAAANVNVRGVAGHFVELNKIYGSARINLDIGRLYQMDVVTMRVFDVLACGGFLLTERSPELSELFEPGHDLEVFTGAEELIDKTRHYLAHPELAARIAAQGRATVLSRHTVDLRLELMLAALPRSAAPPRAARSARSR
jgi:spore maturation protein CgeB